MTATHCLAETVQDLTEIVKTKYDEVLKKSKNGGKSETVCQREATTEAMKLPQYQAIQKWLDIHAEIKLKEAVGKMMTSRKIPCLIIRSVNLKALSALNDFGLKIPENVEVDLIMAYASGDFLHVNIFEVKRADS